MVDRKYYDLLWKYLTSWFADKPNGNFDQTIEALKDHYISQVATFWK